MVTDSKASPEKQPVSRIGLTTIVIGVALANFGPAMFHGFVKGLFLGAGVTLVVIGVFVLSARWRARSDTTWLPSRDDD